MPRIPIPLQVRVVILLGGALAALQLFLGGVYVSTVEESMSLQRQAVRDATQNAVALRVQEAARQQREGLEFFADLGRQQDYIVVEERTVRVERQTQRPRAPAGSSVTTRVLRSERRLEESIDNLTEYRESGAILWYRRDPGALEELSDSLRAGALKLERETRGSASRLLCESAGCVLLSVRPFQTRDRVQIIAVAANALDEIVAAPLDGVGAGALYRWHSEPTQAAAGTAPTGDSWSELMQDLGGVALAEGSLQYPIPLGEELRKLADARDQYVKIAATGVLLSLLLIALSLRGVLRRIGLLTRALPLLTQERFQQAREMLGGGTRRRSITPDETATLLDVASEVAARLEALNGELRDKAAALEQQRDRVALLLNTVPACVLMLDSEARIGSANAMSCQLLGQSESQLLGQSLGELMPRDDQQLFRRAMRRLVHAGVQRHVEARVKGGDLKLHALQWQLAPVGGRADSGQVLAIGLDVTAQRAAEQRLHWLREHDERTGLLNREALLARIQAANRPGVLVYMPLQRKQTIVASLTDSGRAGLAGHIGKILALGSGEGRALEWGVVVDCIFAGYTQDLEQVERRLAEIQKRIQARPYHHDGREFQLEMQPCFIRLHGDEPRDLLQDLLAGLELPVAGETWIDATQLVSLHHEEHRRWVREVSDALAQNRFYLDFQPIFELPGLRASHSEALLRMRGEDGRPIAPGHFLPHAERSGQIVDIDRFVFSCAMNKAAALADSGIRHPLAVNMSAQSMHDDYVLEEVIRRSRAGELQAGSLVLEVLETEAIHNLDSARKMLQDFKSQGVQIALDDFGVGFTSFEYLRELPFDYVKIDRSFVMQLSQRPQDEQLIASIHELVLSLGKKTIAEGVEDAKALNIITQMGIHAAQGYHLGRPGAEIVTGSAPLSLLH